MALCLFVIADHNAACAGAFLQGERRKREQGVLGDDVVKAELE